MHRFRLIVLIMLGLSAMAFAQKRSITEKDLFQFAWIGDPQVSPDGSRVAFVKVTVNIRKDGYDTSIWTVSSRGDEPPRRLTSGNRDASPRWSPDGKWMVFVRAPEAPAMPAPGARPPASQLYLLPAGGGESWKITNLPRGAGSPAWSPDSRMIAFTSTTSPEDLAKVKGAEKDGKEKAPGSHTDEPEHESDVRVITRAVYRSNGAGYLDPKHPVHIWVTAVPLSSEDQVKPRKLTSGWFNEANIHWSSDSRAIYFLSNRDPEPYYSLPRTDIYSVAVGGGDPVKVLAVEMGPRALSFSPDGKRVAFCASVTQPVRSYSQPDLWVADLATGAKPRNLTADYDFDICSGVGGDQGTPRAGGGDEVLWTEDGSGLVAVTAKEGKANLVQVEIATGKMTEITSGNQAVGHYRAFGGGRFVALISTPTTIGDLFVVSHGGKPVQLTHINDKLFSQLNLTAPEEIWYTSFDGKKIQAWVQKPPDFDPAKKYPLILNIHGGPHLAYGYIFDHEFQWMAAKGYVVLYPNPRGSTSYGQEFGNIIQYHYPGDDARDLLAGVDELLKRGYIDAKKLGVTGGSGGGGLTNWIVGHTDRFAAAVSQRDIANWADWWYTADFAQFEPVWFKGPPFRETQDFAARSPITYIENVKTPLMLVLGEADYRTPPDAGGEQMFRALKYLKRPVVMVRFPGESHELSRSGQPWHRIERLQHIVGWFDKYLMSMPKPEYDEPSSRGE